MGSGTQFLNYKCGRPSLAEYNYEDYEILDMYAECTVTGIQRWRYTDKFTAREGVVDQGRDGWT